MNKKVIAIFEDDHVNRFIYERIFQGRNDVTIHIFDTAEKGIAKASETPFDVAFIEIHFWGNFGGLDILNRLRKVLTSKTTFVAMTALLQRGDIERILNSGFHMCIEKPVIFSEMDLLKMNRVVALSGKATDLPLTDLPLQ
jgi:CheY-like chemotaxis protein